jgi:hypothetical protein
LDRAGLKGIGGRSIRHELDEDARWRSEKGFVPVRLFCNGRTGRAGVYRGPAILQKPYLAPESEGLEVIFFLGPVSQLSRVKILRVDADNPMISKSLPVTSREGLPFKDGYPNLDRPMPLIMGSMC